VEDDPSLLIGLGRLLSTQGFETERFYSAEAFLDGARASKAPVLFWIFIWVACPALNSGAD
jgi:FixJ family two-component response regulator